MNFFLKRGIYLVIAVTLFFLFIPFYSNAEEEGISGDIFGKKGGYFHPFISIEEKYSDNIFNTKDDNDESDFITILSPGIRLALPGRKERLLGSRTSTTAPGGLSVSRFEADSFKRYQAYFQYNPEIELYADNSDENTVNHQIDGLFQYNFRGGLSIGLFDQYTDAYDVRATGIATEQDKYKTNLIGVMLAFDVTDKLRLKAGYSNFDVDYDALRNRGRDRRDNAFAGYIFFKFMPKTSVFAEYEFIDVQYDVDVLDDSTENRFFGGLQWDITAKSRGRVKAGYGTKDFDGSEMDDSEEFIFEVQVHHSFTPKTAVSLTAYRRDTETTIITTDYTLTHSINASYRQKIATRFTANLDLSYTKDEFKGDLVFGAESKERIDDYYSVTPSLRYAFRDWLSAGIEYGYTRRDSNFSDFDYTTNTVLFRVTASL